jgi:hypothetical protein
VPHGHTAGFALRAAHQHLLAAAFADAPADSSALRCGLSAGIVALSPVSSPLAYTIQAVSLASAAADTVPGAGTVDACAPAISQGERFVLAPGTGAALQPSLDLTRFSGAPSTAGRMRYVADALRLCWSARAGVAAGLSGRRRGQEVSAMATQSPRSRSSGFAATPLAQFLAGTAGRTVRAVVGVILLIVGLAVIGGVIGVIVAIIGLVPIAAGLFDFCLLSALLGGPLWGRDIRAAGRR